MYGTGHKRITACVTISLSMQHEPSMSVEVSCLFTRSIDRTLKLEDNLEQSISACSYNIPPSLVPTRRPSMTPVSKEMWTSEQCPRCSTTQSMVSLIPCCETSSKLTVFTPRSLSVLLVYPITTTFSGSTGARQYILSGPYPHNCNTASSLISFDANTMPVSMTPHLLTTLGMVQKGILGHEPQNRVKSDGYAHRVTIEAVKNSSVRSNS